MRNLLIVLFASIALNAYGQKVNIINHEATQFQLREKNDTINFIVVDTTLEKKKPIFLFCQGSLPRPLFMKWKGQGIWMYGGGISNFDIKTIKKYYHLVVISMPHTPIIANIKHLNENYCYVTDTTIPNSFRIAYFKADYLQNYVRRANAVLDFLKKQYWIDTSKIVVAGSSQGSYIAAEIALSRNDITCVGLFAANPFGRLDQYIRQARLNAELGKITWQQADSTMNYWYNFFKNANSPDSIAKYPQYIAWKSFSRPLIGDWLKLKVPIYLAYGTADITSALDDIVPLYFIRAHKNNLTFKRYLGMNHNFFYLDKNGKPIYKKPNWPKVMNTFVKWTLQFK